MACRMDPAHGSHGTGLAPDTGGQSSRVPHASRAVHTAS